MSRRNVLSVVAAMCGLFAVAGPVQAGMSAWESVNVDKAAGNATFSINFGHAPNFTTEDSHGRVADSFQILIAADPVGANPFIAPTTVLRGDEIHFTGAIPVRNGSPADFSDPHSGGWGTVRGAVPFAVNGSEVTFTAPLSLLGAADGRFAYDVSTFASGLTAGEARSQSVPLPSALPIGMAMLAIGLGITRFRRLQA
jgi:hypothetical protein